MYLQKLKTREDPYYLHKVLGITCLFNYIYRFGSIILTGDMNMNNNLGLYLLCFHMLLSVSSLIFKISAFRNKTSPMIYPELRLHSIVFTARSFICCLLSFYKYNVVHKMLTCILTMFFADIVTHFYKNGTTIRGTPFCDNIKEDQRKAIIRMYSGAQLAAPLLCLENMDTAFSPLFPIQIAAFTMTLVRKGIIANKTSQLIYTLALMSTSLGILSMSPIVFVRFLIATRLVSFLRFNMNINKYICWSIIFSLYLYIDIDAYVISPDSYLNETTLYQLVVIVPLIYSNLQKLYKFNHLFV